VPPDRSLYKVSIAAAPPATWYDRADKYPVTFVISAMAIKF
jgi:hypothetical protein